MKKITFYFLIFLNVYQIQSQEIEKAINNKNKSLALINAFVNSTYQGNSVTNFSDYNIDTKKVDKYTLMLKVLKYKNFKENTEFLLNQFAKDTIFNKKSRKFKDTPATNIIKKAIKKRKEIYKKTKFYTANYYSKNKIYIKDAPKKILSINLGDLGGGLDKSRSGMVYLSETYSEIYKKRKQFKENILAVKVNGIDYKVGFNRAHNSNFNFYNNQVTLGDKIISPIAKTAPLHYKYKLEDTFVKNGFTIYKIKVIPRRKIDNVFNGTIYIVKDFWQIFKIDLYIKGKQIQQPIIDKIKIKQIYKFSKKDNLWLLANQKSDFKISQFSVNLNGTLFAHYSNYNFNKKALLKQFDKTVLSVDDNATQKSDVYWNSIRPIPLSKEEKQEYDFKDKIQKKRSSFHYLDSLNTIKNKFYFSDLIFDYNHRNLYKNNRFKISFPLNTMFNTIQGFNSTTTFDYYKDKKHQNYNIGTSLNYGFIDKQLRATAHLIYQFNDKVNSVIKISVGRKLTEFNDPYSTAPLFNTFSSLFFEENSSKFYDKYFAQINYHQEIVNGVFINSRLAYEDRKPVFNTSYFTVFNWDNTVYTSNNPLKPNDYNSAIIERHQLYKFNITAAFIIGQKQLLLPNKKVNLNTNYPKLSLQYIKGFSFKKHNYNFDYLETRIFQHFNISNKGVFSYNIKGGKFLNQNTLSFIDYKHFDITQVHVSLVKDYTNHFALLPSYAFSTNDSFAEFHIEHQFNGYILNKIPLINKFQNKLIIGANTLLTQENKPYSEINIGLNNIGFGKYRFLRVDYVRSFFNGKSIGSLIFGLSL